MRRTLSVLALTIAALAALVSAANADFPYGTGAPHYKTGPGVTPNDIAGDSNEFKYAATPEATSPWTSSASELFGVRGAHVVDADAGVDTAWQNSTGRADVVLSVLDSGIRWNDAGAMGDLRRKTHLNKGELPLPQGCTQYDCNGDSVFNVVDYAGDTRVDLE